MHFVQLVIPMFRWLPASQGANAAVVQTSAAAALPSVVDLCCSSDSKQQLVS